MRTTILLLTILASFGAEYPSYPVVQPVPLTQPAAIVSIDFPSYPVVTPVPVSVQPEQAPTPIVEVRRVLAILRPKSHEMFIDFGCGDGRWLIEAARTYKCRAVGIEINPIQAERTRRAVVAAGLGDKVQVIVGDATTVDVDAQVGVAYLYPNVLVRLKPKLLKLKRFATYMHRVDGVVMQQNGDAWVWTKPEPMFVTPYAWYGGQTYTGRVCNSPYCSMCNSIARQLGQ